MGEYKFSVEVSDKKEAYLMEAYFTATCFPGSSDGYDLNQESILAFLRENHIVHGVLDSAVERIISQSYAQKELIAKGTPPETGAGRLFEMLVPEEVFEYERFASPEILDMDIYEFPDYRIPTVKANSPLMRKIPAQTGQPGKNVIGQTLAGIRGADKNFPKAKMPPYPLKIKNVLIATVDGYPFINDHFVSVERVHTVDKDVVQSLEFDGIVMIRGSIKDQLRVVATSDVVILGATEAVVVESGRNVVISGGVKGKEMAVMKSKNDIISRFVEMCTLEAGGDVFAKNITQTFAVALGNIYAERIVGGEVRASGLVETSIIGSDGVDTGITAGPNPYLDDKINQVREEVNQVRGSLQSNMAEISRLVFTEKRKNDDPELVELRAKLPVLEFELQKLYAVVERLKQYAADVSNGSVVVYEAVYPGTIIMFGDFEYMIEETESNIAYRSGKYGVIRQSLDEEATEEEESEEEPEE